MLVASPAAAECLSALSLPEWKTIVDIVSGLVTIGAILVGAWWAYTKFIRERTPNRHANLELVISDRALTSDQALIHVAATVTNTGTTLIKLSSLRVEVLRVLPLTDEIAEKVDARELPKLIGAETAWPLIKREKCQWGAGQFEIEPDEHDGIGFDFLIPGEIKTVFVYAYLENSEKSVEGRQIGWSASAFHDLAAAPADAGSNVASGETRVSSERTKQQEPRPERPPEKPDEHIEEGQREPRPEQPASPPPPSPEEQGDK